ncbi:hypothetical protein [Dactylosporangium sp. NPDC051541]|uniref:hypothetical protein n=1 Tax=Dactylosporangium sp. NPDC051541 TaxID=3363977 RepID=UPI00378C058D
MSISMPPTDNPAGRLWAILVAAQAVDPDAPALAGWTTALGVDVHRTSDTLRAFSLVADLNAKVRTQIAELPFEADPSAIASHLGEIDGVIDRLPRLADYSMSWSLAGLTDAGMLSLRICASTLGRYLSEPVLSRDQLRILSTQVDDLVESVRSSSDLDARLQRFILDLLLKVKFALDNYRILGLLPLEAATNELVGALARQSSVPDQIAESKLAKGFFAFFVAIDLALNVAANIHSLEKPPASSPSPVVIQVVQRCDLPIELPRDAWSPDDGLSHAKPPDPPTKHGRSGGARSSVPHDLPDF